MEPGSWRQYRRTTGYCPAGATFSGRSPGKSIDSRLPQGPSRLNLLNYSSSSCPGRLREWFLKRFGARRDELVHRVYWEFMTDQLSYTLPLKELPTHWYNILPDFPQPLPPPLNPATRQPIEPAALARIFPENLIAQEVSPE